MNLVMADTFCGVSVLTDNQRGSCGSRACLHMLFMLCVHGSDLNMLECLISSDTIASVGIVVPLWVSLLILYARHMEDVLPCGLLGNVTVGVETKHLIGCLNERLRDCSVSNHV